VHVLTTRSFGTGLIVRVVTVIVFAIFPTDVTIPVLISGIVVGACRNDCIYKAERWKR
jgi:hypothetical protein